MNAQFDGVALDEGAGAQRVGMRCGLVVGHQRVGEVLVDAAHAAFHERGRKIVDYLRIAASLGRHGLAYVGRGPHVEVGQGADEAVGPVLRAQRHLLARCELQGAVGTEVHDGVGSESVARPEVGGDIVVGRGGVGAVHNLEIVVAESGGRLRNEHDVAELQAAEGEAPPAVGHGVAGEGAVDGVGLCAQAGADGCLRPAVVVVLADELG